MIGRFYVVDLAVTVAVKADFDRDRQRVKLHLTRCAAGNRTPTR